MNEGADLPDAPIELTYYPNITAGTVLLLKDALSDFSTQFEQELRDAQYLFENMKPTVTGHGYYTRDNPERLAYVRVRAPTTPACGGPPTSHVFHVVFLTRTQRTA